MQAVNFARFQQEPIEIAVSQTARVEVNLELATVAEPVTIDADAIQVDTATNTLGKTINGREVLDLPPNGRRLTQFGWLQARWRR